MPLGRQGIALWDQLSAGWPSLTSALPPPPPPNQQTLQAPAWSLPAYPKAPALRPQVHPQPASSQTQGTLTGKRFTSLTSVVNSFWEDTSPEKHLVDERLHHNDDSVPAEPFPSWSSAVIRKHPLWRSDSQNKLLCLRESTLNSILQNYLP